MAQGKPVKQTIRDFRPVALRLFPEETAALQELAIAEDRTIASLCRIVIRDWMRQKGIGVKKERQ